MNQKNRKYAFLAVGGLVMLACGSSSASAQSLPGTGTFYVGAHATYADNSSVWDDVNAGYLGEHGANGLRFGAQAGYDLNLGPVFVGAAATFRPNGVSGSHTDLKFSDKATQYDRSDEKWSAQFAGRVGTDIRGYRFYGKAGLALSRKRYSLVGFTIENTDFTAKTITRAGWLVGAGVERDVAPRVSVFVDYAHADFGNPTTIFPCPETQMDCTPLGTKDIPIRLDDKANNVSVGFNVRF